MLPLCDLPSHVTNHPLPTVISEILTWEVSLDTNKTVNILKVEQAEKNVSPLKKPWADPRVWVCSFSVLIALVKEAVLEWLRRNGRWKWLQYLNQALCNRYGQQKQWQKRKSNHILLQYEKTLRKSWATFLQWSPVYHEKSRGSLNLKASTAYKIHQDATQCGSTPKPSVEVIPVLPGNDREPVKKSLCGKKCDPSHCLLQHTRCRILNKLEAV